MPLKYPDPLRGYAFETVYNYTVKNWKGWIYETSYTTGIPETTHWRLILYFDKTKQQKQKKQTMCGVVRYKGNVEQNNTRIDWEVDALPLRQLREPLGLGLLSQRCKRQRHRRSHGRSRLGHKLSPSFGNRSVVGRRGGGGSSGDDEAGGSSCCLGFVEEALE